MDVKVALTRARENEDEAPTIEITAFGDHHEYCDAITEQLSMDEVRNLIGDLTQALAAAQAAYER